MIVSLGHHRDRRGFSLYFEINLLTTKPPAEDAGRGWIRGRDLRHRFNRQQYKFTRIETGEQNRAELVRFINEPGPLSGGNEREKVGARLPFVELFRRSELRDTHEIVQP